MALQIRVECDAQACGAWTIALVEFDRSEGRTLLIDGEPRAMVEFEGRAGLTAGWVLGAHGRAYCAEHGAVCGACVRGILPGGLTCTACGGAGAGLAQPRRLRSAA